MDLQERIELVLSFEKTKKDWRAKFNSREFREASALNHLLFGMHLNKKVKCDCVEDLFFMLKSYRKEDINHKQIQMNSNFKLKKGKVIALHGMNEVITNANLTDDKAIELLKKFPGHAKSFEVLPENWQEVVAGKPAKTEEDLQAEVDANIKKTLKAKKLDELKKDAEQFPKEEWENMKKAELEAYIFDKLKAAK